MLLSWHKIIEILHTNDTQSLQSLLQTLYTLLALLGCHDQSVLTLKSVQVFA